jgi:hypothetical protein
VLAIPTPDLDATYDLRRAEGLPVTLEPEDAYWAIRMPPPGVPALGQSAAWEGTTLHLAHRPCRQLRRTEREPR